MNFVAVSIPTPHVNQEKSREATDLANFRAAKAHMVVDYLSGELLPQGWYDASKGVFVEEQGEIAGVLEKEQKYWADCCR